MTNKQIFRDLINRLASSLSDGQTEFLVNRKIGEQSGFPDGAELFTPAGKITIKYTDRPILGFEKRKVKKAA